MEFHIVIIVKTPFILHMALFSTTIYFNEVYNRKCIPPMADQTEYLSSYTILDQQYTGFHAHAVLLNASRRQRILELMINKKLPTRNPFSS